MMKIGMIAIAAMALAAQAGVNTTVVTFDNGTEGWEGPQGIGGSTFIDATHGVGGGAGYRTQFNNFGIEFGNSTNPAFVDDLTQYQQVTISVDLKVDQIGSFLPVSRPFMLELRDYDATQGGLPWSSAFFVFDYVSQDTYSDFVTLSVTIDNTMSAALPAGWGGFGAEDPMTFAPILPAGVTFADILSGYDEMVFSTLEPGFFFSFDDYDMTLDNITISKVIPAPGSAALMLGTGLFASRRRRA